MSIPCILPELFIFHIVLRPHVNRRLTYPPSLDSSSIVRTVCYCILLYFLSHFFLSLFSHSFSIFFLWFFFFFFFPYFTFTISLVFFSLSSFGLIMFCSIDIFSRLASAPLSRASTMSYLTFVSPIILGFLLSLFFSPIISGAYNLGPPSAPLSPASAMSFFTCFGPIIWGVKGVTGFGRVIQFRWFGRTRIRFGIHPVSLEKKKCQFLKAKTSLTDFRHQMRSGDLPASLSLSCP